MLTGRELHALVDSMLRRLRLAGGIFPILHHRYKAPFQLLGRLNFLEFVLFVCAELFISQYFIFNFFEVHGADFLLVFLALLQNSIYLLFILLSDLSSMAFEEGFTVFHF